MIKTVFAVVGLLWLAKRVQHAKEVENNLTQMEAAPTDPYASVTWQWDALNGTNLTADGGHPNAHPAFSTLRVNSTYPALSRACICR